MQYGEMLTKTHRIIIPYDIERIDTKIKLHLKNGQGAQEHVSIQVTNITARFIFC